MIFLKNYCIENEMSSLELPIYSQYLNSIKNQFARKRYNLKAKV